MAKDRYGLWSPHRDSPHVLEFQSLLSYRRNEPWVWHNSPAAASWWVVDGAYRDIATITELLRTERALESGNILTHGAILANDWTSVSHPIWTFFKIPLRAQLIYNWVDSAQKRMGTAVAPFHKHMFRLRRWPNMSRYARELDTVQSMNLTMACTHALKQHVGYTELVTLVGAANSKIVDSLLCDALQDGILELSASQATVPARPAPPPANPASNHKGWSLVRRLIEKFS